ncbi:MULTISPECIES: SAM-dependent methyltransferase [unclassified Parafrankia]|uniref:SAM-dependent methyltransferase n=1 Tax=unclassified Parafrankia TaxID=2994368 RepID=UPI000DA4541B|nr:MULTISPECIES: SAM-dependent methyltransferase [unclassified Parafrankia]TCJ35607.1 SAM-dependent methyltransferase [Parafrankia sp. BMG5.11]CAI7977364.1 putative O-methyltransferase [Frankia sp. Hr75.2]SQD95820.1 putative O-methyltransferase [Parafrankia sp. Ea1.12]
MTNNTPGKGRWRKLMDEIPTVDLRTDLPHSARMYDYYLGGKDNFPADRAAADQALHAFPGLQVTARQNRAFLIRATRHLAGELGIRQFLDIGTGIPTSPNLHEVAQGITPEARVVYADNDPIVLTHARALLTSSPQGRTAYLDADIRDPARILRAPELLDTLDLTQPVALSLVAIFHFIPDSDDPYGIVGTLMDALPAGSTLTLTHVTPDFAPQEVERLAEIYRKQGIPARPRTHSEVVRFFDGLDLVDPGVQLLHRWRPDDDTPTGLTDAEVGGYGAIARKA